jgi:hypothetical protein
MSQQLHFQMLFAMFFFVFNNVHKQNWFVANLQFELNKISSKVQILVQVKSSFEQWQIFPLSSQILPNS